GDTDRRPEIVGRQFHIAEYGGLGAQRQDGGRYQTDYKNGAQTDAWQRQGDQKPVDRLADPFFHRALVYFGLVVQKRPCNLLVTRDRAMAYGILSRSARRASSRIHFCNMSTDYLKRILTSKVYDVANETSLDFAPQISARIHNSIYLKRED